MRMVFIAAAMLLWLSTSTRLNAASDDWVAPASAHDRKNPIAASAQALAAGRASFTDRCAGCHGDTGHGDGPGAAFSTVPPGDLTTRSVAEQTDGDLFFKMTTGRRPMPSFEDKLSEEERWQVVLYVRDLARASEEANGESRPPDQDDGHH